MPLDAHSGPPASRPHTAPTFVGLPYAEGTAGADLAVIGLACDERGPGGAALAPHAVRVASSTLTPFYSPSQRQNVLPALAAVDLSDVESAVGESGDALEPLTVTLSRVMAAGAVALGLGGDQTVTLAGLRAGAASHGPLALVLFDAHLDEGVGAARAARRAHTGVVRHALDEGLIDPGRSTVLGPRGGTAAAGAYDELRELGLLLFAWDELAQLGSGAVAAAVERAAGKAYLSIDVDVADPAFAPGVHWPLAGGPASAQVIALVRAARGLDLVGADVVGAVPARDPAGITSVLAATLAWEVMTLVACGKGAVP